MRRILLYTKPGCHLCEEALDLLLAFGDEMEGQLAIEEINILDDPGLYARFKQVIPVIVIDPDGSGPTLYAPITPTTLRRALMPGQRGKGHSDGVLGASKPLSFRG
jgi:glutaredoxin